MQKYEIDGKVVYSFESLDIETIKKLIKNCGENDEYLVVKEGNEYCISKSQCFLDYIKSLKENAILDPLTRVYNKREILNFLEKFLANFIRYKKEPFSVMMLDIDFFKKINDTYGHLAGDFVLKEFVKIIKNKIRSSDILGRFGGEEFILILPNTKISGALKLAMRIKEEVENHIFEYGKEKIKVTTSIGITSVSLNDSVESLLERVDEALYDAKRKGRNRIEYR